MKFHQALCYLLFPCSIVRDSLLVPSHDYIAALHHSIFLILHPLIFPSNNHNYNHNHSKATKLPKNQRRISRIPAPLKTESKIKTAKMQYGTALIALCGLVPAISSHMIMKTPTPYGAATINNSPLAADGSDYPCKQRPGVYDIGSAKNEMAIGTPQELSFTGSAVHGGGSCQVSLTKDLKPTKDSKFFVITSIEGGCPANSAGNLGEDPNGSGASTFQFAIPQGTEPGQYTLAWTWFNKIGNREMYMNCAPITVTGSKKARYLSSNATEAAFAFGLDDSTLPKRDLSSLPEMFKANIQSVSGDCHTADSADLAFPNPGKVVQKKGSSPLTPPTGNCGGSSSNAAGAQAAQPSAAAAAQPSAAAAAQPSAAAAQPSAAAAAQPSSAGSASSAGSSSAGSSAGSSSAGGMTCSSDGTHFQMGAGAPLQPVAAGTKCANGAIQMASAMKRSAKFRI